jgi:hypothetical protein
VSESQKDEQVDRDRLRALAKLGLAVGIAYVAPSLVIIPRVNAKHCTGHVPGPGGGGPPPC